MQADYSLCRDIMRGCHPAYPNAIHLGPVRQTARSHPRQGAVEKQHLDYYLDELTFRFNRRSSRSRGMLFYRLLQQAVATHPVPRTTILGGSSVRRVAQKGDVDQNSKIGPLHIVACGAKHLAQCGDFHPHLFFPTAQTAMKKPSRRGSSDSEFIASPICSSSSSSDSAGSAPSEPT